jgi:hypothetical protein
MAQYGGLQDSGGFTTDLFTISGMAVPVALPAVPDLQSLLPFDLPLQLQDAIQQSLGRGWAACGDPSVCSSLYLRLPLSSTVQVPPKGLQGAEAQGPGSPIHFPESYPCSAVCPPSYPLLLSRLSPKGLIRAAEQAR